MSKPDLYSIWASIDREIEATTNTDITDRSPLAEINNLQEQLLNLVNLLIEEEGK